MNPVSIIVHTGTPYSLQPVVNPTLKAGNTTYQVNLNISSHPDVSFATWLRNGVDIINDDHISPGLESMTFMSLMPKDNGTYSVIVYNRIGNTTIPFNMMVLCELYYNRVSVVID